MTYLLLSPPQTSRNQIKVDLVDENFTELRGEIAGPPDTPYEGKSVYTHLYTLTVYTFLHSHTHTTLTGLFFYTGGRFQLEIKIPETYPFNPPKVGDLALQYVYRHYVV